jgi:hypothetical protein
MKKKLTETGKVCEEKVDRNREGNYMKKRLTATGKVIFK